MKLSKRIKSYARVGARVIGSLVATITVGLEFGEHGNDILEFARKLVSSVLDHFFPGVPANYQFINLFVWLVIFVLFCICWFILFFIIRRMAERFLKGLISHLVLESEERVKVLNREAFEDVLQGPLEGLEARVKQLHKMVEPLVAPSAISGTTCMLPGVYCIQEEVFQDAERTFAEGEIFPWVPHPVTGVEVKVTWVYQSPAMRKKHLE